MCGIAGVVRPGGAAPIDLARAMADALAHRGPDDAGASAHGPVALGNRRLSVVDLSPLGHMPRESSDGRHTLTYNGEVYNHSELRTELESLGRRFRSRSDSEVVLEALATWGESAIPRFNGMFAFAWHDHLLGKLVLARDRVGIKPLYYARAGGDLLFASEVKAFLSHPAFNVEVDAAALREYFTFQNLFSDRTLFAGVRLLKPGHLLVVETASGTITEHQWWDLDMRNPLDPARTSFEEAAAEVRRLFERAVDRQLMGDVPVGSFLSGGMDSGSIVAVAAQRLPGLSTFTAGFAMGGVEGPEAGFDERAAARLLASQVGTTHHEQVLHPGDMPEVLSDLVWHLEDPRVGMCWQDWHACRMAAKEVTVCLSGAGGDELFAGYPWRYAAVQGSRSRQAFLDASYALWQRLVPESGHAAFFSDPVMAATTEFQARQPLEAVLKGARVKEDSWVDLELYFEFKTFLHGLMVVGDKISSAHSLEVRVPFLDNELIDYAARLPIEYKLDLQSGISGQEGSKSGQGKRILRHAMRGLIPDELRERPKQGFSPPDAAWYRGANLDYLRSTLLGEDAKSRPYFQPGAIERVIEEHVSQTRNHRLLLWSLLCFEWWCRRFIAPRGVRAVQVWAREEAGPPRRST